MNRQEPNSPVRDIRSYCDRVVVELVGDIDMEHSAAFQQGMADVMARGAGHVILDMAGVGYMDSSGIASMVKLHTQAKAGGATLSLVGVHQNVQSIFEITRLDGLFKVFATEQQAIASA